MTLSYTSPQKKELLQLRKKIGANIHEIRRKKKVTLRRLSRLTNLSMNQLDAFELGKHNIGLYDMIKIASVMDVNVLRFMQR